MKCYASDICNKVSLEACNKSCKAFVWLEAIYISSNIPLLYQFDKKLIPPKLDLNNFKKLDVIKKDVIKFVEEGKNIFLYSSIPGTGKTSWMCKIANEYIRKNLFSSKFDSLIYFANSSEVMEELRLGYEDGSYKSIMNKLKDSSLLILDDLGAEKTTEWVRERFYEIINYRINNELSTFYSSNLSIEDLEIKLGSRIISRLGFKAKIIKLDGNDRRKLECGN